MAGGKENSTGTYCSINTDSCTQSRSEFFRALFVFCTKELTKPAALQYDQVPRTQRIALPLRRHPNALLDKYMQDEPMDCCAVSSQAPGVSDKYRGNAGVLLQCPCTPWTLLSITMFRESTGILSNFEYLEFSAG